MSNHDTAKPPLIEARELRISFAGCGGRARAVDGLSFHVDAGEVLAIVGESGSGKTLSCRALMGLTPRTASVSGSVRLQGRELIGLEECELTRYRGAAIAMIFQNPAQSLNPIQRVGSQVAEAIGKHERCSRRAAWPEAIDMLHRVGLAAPQEIARSYPHQLSGGMQQRVMIAIALAGKPKLLIADEATKSLDAATQINILSLLLDLRRRHGMALILVSHDLELALSCADRVIVMQDGRMIEEAEASRLRTGAATPYARALLDAALQIRGRKPREVAPQLFRPADHDVTPAVPGGSV